MSYSRSAIITEVQTKLGEITPFDENEVADSDQLDGLLDAATRTVLLEAQLHLIDTDDVSLTGQSHSSDGTGYVKLPTDYLRFAGLKMSSWERTVYELLNEEDPRARHQQYSHIRGGNAKPVVIKEQDATNGYTIKYYSGSGTHTVTFAKYIKEPVAEADPILIQSELLEPLAWQTAGDYLRIFESPESAKLAYEKVTEYYQNHKP